MSEGSIIKRVGKGGAVSYLLKYDAGRDAHGKRQQRYKTVRGTKKEAEAELRRLLHEVDKGTHVDPTNLTLSKWADAWLQGLQASEKVGVRTLEGYSDWLKLYVLPKLGGVKLQKLTATQIDSLYVHLLTQGRRSKAGGEDGEVKGLSPQTVLHIHRTLFQCLKAAKKKRQIAHNPAEDADAPKPKRTRNHGSEDEGSGPVRALDKEQVPALLAAFKGKMLYPVVVLGLSTGLRRSEMLALRWSSVNFEKKTLRVQRVVEVSRQYGVRIKADAKTESSRRTIKIPEELCNLLRAHRTEQKALALKLGVSYPSDCLVFPCVIKRTRGGQVATEGRAESADFNRVWHPTAISKEFVRVAAAAGFGEFTLHSLRHTHATHLLLEGTPVHSVAQRLGHSTPVITMTTYAHVLQRAEDRAADVAGELLRGAMGG